ncbi:MAG: hypothetical protein QXQ28_00220 [Candidatus Nezhaarchaeales archaeon]
MTKEACDDLRLVLQCQIWMALELLRAKYDARFKELEERIKAHFEPLSSPYATRFNRPKTKVNRTVVSKS